MNLQLPLPMITHYSGPRIVAQEVLAGIRSYRDAVRTCHRLRTRKNLSLRLLAEEAGLYPSHVSDYLSEHATKRELPAKHIAAFEVACGNRVISQWMARQANLTILEQYIEQQRMAA